MDIGQSLAKIVDQNVRFAIHFGEVTAVATTPDTISVKISGSSTAISGIRYLDSYTPLVDDIVVLIVNKGDIFALGDLA
jgi:hypothetical protein